MKKIVDIGVQTAKEGALYGRFWLFELFLFNDFCLLLFLILIKYEVTHLPLQLFFHIQGLLELMIAIFKLALSWLLNIDLLVEFSFLPAENASYLLCNNHEWPKGLLQAVGDWLEEEIGREEVDFSGIGLVLEHIFPDLVCSHEESKAYRLNWGIGGLGNGNSGFDGVLLLHFTFEFCEVLWIEGGLCGI